MLVDRRVYDHHPPPLRLPTRRRRRRVFAQDPVKEDTLSRRGTFVGLANRLANSVYPLFFQFWQCCSCRLQVHSFLGRTSFAGSPQGEEGGKLLKQRLRTERACGEEAWITTVARGKRGRRGVTDSFACWLIYHATRRDCGESARTSAETRPSGCIFCD